MKKISEYNDKRLCECFDCFNMKQHEGKNITQVNIELKDKTDAMVVKLERGKYLSYFDMKFAKVDESGIIHVFKDYL